MGGSDLKKHIFFIAAICLLLASCAQKPAEEIYSEEQSSAADLTETISENNIPEESEDSDSIAESSISLSDESENDDNSEDEISRQLEPVVKKLVAGEQMWTTAPINQCSSVFSYDMPDDNGNDMHISVVRDDYKFYMLINDSCYLLDSDSYEEINGLFSAENSDPAGRLIGSKFECDEPVTNEDYIMAAQGCVFSWLETLKSESGEYAVTSYGASSDKPGKFLAAGMVCGAKEFAVEVLFSVGIPSLYKESVFREPSNSGYNTFYHYYDGTCAFVRCRWENGVCTVVDYDGAHMASLSEGLNGINTNSQYATFFDFLNDREAVLDYKKNGAKSDEPIVISHNPYMISDGRIFFADIDLSADSRLKELPDGRVSAQFGDSFYSAEGIGVYSSPVRYNDNARAPYTITLSRDFDLVFDDYNYDGNPDYTIKVKEDENGALYRVEGIANDGSPRASRDEIYMAGRFEDSIRLQNTSSGYVEWSLDDSGNMTPSIAVDDYTMYSQRYHLPVQLRGYSESDSRIICYFWNNTDKEVSVGGNFTVERNDGGIWTEVMSGGSVQNQSILPYHEGEFEFDISKLTDRKAGEYRIAITCGKSKVYGGFFIDGETDENYKIECSEKELPAGRLSIPFELKNTGIFPIRITSAELIRDGSKICDIDVSHLGLLSEGETITLEALSKSYEGFGEGKYSVKLCCGSHSFTVGNTVLLDVPESSRTYFNGTAEAYCENGRYFITVKNGIYDRSDASIGELYSIELLNEGEWIYTGYSAEGYYFAVPYGESLTLVFSDIIEMYLSNEEYSDYLREAYEMREEELALWLRDEQITEEEYDYFIGLEFEEYLREIFEIPDTSITENDLCRIYLAGEYVYFKVK